MKRARIESPGVCVSFGKKDPGKKSYCKFMTKVLFDLVHTFHTMHTPVD